MQETLRAIRLRLRLAMNGVVSTSMREKGLNYKLNFGVSLPHLKKIAQDFTPDADLAVLLWQQEVREMKILATLLQPVDAFSREQAEEWGATVSNEEIAGMLAMNLLSALSFARELAIDWIQGEEGFKPLLGYLILIRLFMQSVSLTNEEEEQFLSATQKRLDQESSATESLQALNALKRFGSLSPEKADRVLTFFAAYAEADQEIKRTVYEDLIFEFEYNK